MTVEKLIEELQRLNPKAQVMVGENRDHVTIRDLRLRRWQKLPSGKRELTPTFGGKAAVVLLYTRKLRKGDF